MNFPSKIRWLCTAWCTFVCIALPISFAAIAKPVSQKPDAATLSYASVDECIISRHIEEGMCRTAFANARAEFEEKAPRFPHRQACEAHFAQCSVYVSSRPPTPGEQAMRGTAPQFLPLMSGVAMAKSKEGTRNALPATKFIRIKPDFSARSAIVSDIEIIEKRGEAARQKWQAAMARASRPPPQNYLAGNTGDVEVSFSDPQANFATDTPASYPVSAKRWNQIQSDIERIKRGQAATAVK